MSIIFAIILGVYAAMRLSLWIRGQCRLCINAQTHLPALPSPVPPPAHLHPELQVFFRHCDEVQRELSKQRRQIAKARLCDPDEFFGFLRDPRYRRAVFESSNALEQWLHRTQDFFGGPRRLCRRWPISPECAQSTLLAIGPQLRSVKQSRALEPFPLDDVERLDRALTSFLNKIDITLHRLSQSHAVSYRITPAHTTDAWPESSPTF